MTSWQITRIFAGSFILISLSLGVPASPLYISAYWLLLTAFVGLNQLQSAFSGWCPAMWMLKKAGFRQEVPVDGAAGSN